MRQPSLVALLSSRKKGHEKKHLQSFHMFYHEVRVLDYVWLSASLWASKLLSAELRE